MLMHHKKIVLPVFCSLIIPLLLMTLFLSMSGVHGMFSESGMLKREFDAIQKEALINNMGTDGYESDLANYLAKDTQDSNYDRELQKYLVENGFDSTEFIKRLFTIKNLVLLISFLLIGFIGSIYFSSMSNALIALTLTHKETNLDNLLRVTNRFFFRFISAIVIVRFIVMVPIILVVGAIGILIFFHPFIGIPAMILFMILLIIYVVLANVRLLFTIPSMYLEEKGPIKSVQHSYKITNGHLRQVVVIFFILYGLTIFMNSFIGTPLKTAYSDFLIEVDWLKISINFIFVILFLTVESFIFTFEHLFTFYAYFDFKELDEVVK